jgi:hypothetical protein
MEELLEGVTNGLRKRSKPPAGAVPIHRPLAAHFCSATLSSLSTG